MDVPLPIPCPQCAAPAEARVVNALPYRIVDALNCDGSVLVYEAVELLEVVTVRCSAGHRFSGPAEAVLRPLPVAARDPAQP
jgi:hypothetical protein